MECITPFLVLCICDFDIDFDSLTHVSSVVGGQERKEEMFFWWWMQTTMNIFAYRCNVLFFLSALSFLQYVVLGLWCMC